MRNKIKQQKLHSYLNIVVLCIYSPRCSQAAEDVETET